MVLSDEKSKNVRENSVSSICNQRNQPNPSIIRGTDLLNDDGAGKLGEIGEIHFHSDKQSTTAL